MTWWRYLRIVSGATGAVIVAGCKGLNLKAC